jgi:hypothetical protein
MMMSVVSAVLLVASTVMLFLIRGEAKKVEADSDLESRIAQWLLAERERIETDRPERELWFPLETSVGRLEVEMPVFSVGGPMWREIGGHAVTTTHKPNPGRVVYSLEARGRVLIPAGHQNVKLRMGPGPVDLTPLSRLGADSLDILSLGNAEIDPSQLASIAHLSGLRTLELPRHAIGEEGLAQLERLTGLREINLLAEASISARGFASISRLKDLRKLIVADDAVSSDILTRYRRSRPGVEVIQAARASLFGFVFSNRFTPTPVPPPSPSRPIG